MEISHHNVLVMTAEGENQLPARITAEGVIVAVRLTPKASSDAVTGVEISAEGPVLKARVRAIPDKGKANEAIAVLLAKWLGVPKSSAALASGGKSRSKQVLVKGDADELMERLAARIADL
ncbi:MAG: DUF167 family protein [Alphaproteobacteria bacterium]